MNAIDMVEPQASDVQFVYNKEHKWFVEILWYNDADDCFVRSWAHHKRKPFMGDYGFLTIEDAFMWCLRNNLRGYLFPPTGNGLSELRVRIYWSDNGPSLDTRSVIEFYDLGGDVV